jgi:hypothetical protein
MRSSSSVDVPFSAKKHFCSVHCCLSCVYIHPHLHAHLMLVTYRGADKSLDRPTSLSVFSVQGTGGSPTGPDPENRVGDQDVRSSGRPVSSDLQVPSEPFPSWSG